MHVELDGPIILLMKPKDLLSIWKTQADIARALDIKPPSVSLWFSSGEIPLDRQYQIELATCGKLKADKPALAVPVQD